MPGFTIAPPVAVGCAPAGRNRRRLASACRSSCGAALVRPHALRPRRAQPAPGRRPLPRRVRHQPARVRLDAHRHPLGARVRRVRAAVRRSGRRRRDRAADRPRREARRGDARDAVVGGRGRGGALPVRGGDGPRPARHLDGAAGVAAVLLRLRRAATSRRPSERAFALSFARRGAVGVAVWIKPHCVLMAAGVWLVTAWRVGGASASRGAASRPTCSATSPAGLRRLGRDRGCPRHRDVAAFWEVMTVWAPEYTELARRELDMRYDQELHWFPPWSLWLVPTVPLAVLSSSTRRRGRPPAATTRAGRPRSAAWLWDREAGRGCPLRSRRSRRCTSSGRAVLLRPARVHVRPHGRTVPHVRPVGGAPLGDAGVVILWLALTSTAWLVGDSRRPFAAHVSDRAARQPTRLRSGLRTLLRASSARGPERLRSGPSAGAPT